MSLDAVRPSRRLSALSSRRFLVVARANFNAKERPTKLLARALCCSLNTARRILRPGAPAFRIREVYAARLAAHLGVSKTSVTREPIDISDNFFEEWTLASDPHSARNAARRLGLAMERVVIHSFGFVCDLEFHNNADHSTSVVALIIRPYADVSAAHIIAFQLRDLRVELSHRMPDGGLTHTSKASLTTVRKLLEIIKNFSIKSNNKLPI